MAIKSGFFNSVNKDRLYDALDMSSLFDGILRDGVFMSIGTRFIALATSGMMINIGIGRAWFNRTWIWNDSVLPITLDQSEVLQDRIDTIVLDINSNNEVRRNDIIIVKGTPSVNPVRPNLIRTLLHNQYPICDIRVNRGVTAITQSNITNRVGTSDCPFVTGILDTVDIDSLLIQWTNQWELYFNDKIDEWDSWFSQTTFNANTENANWREERDEIFNSWFSELQIILDDDVAANLAAEVIQLKNRMDVVEDFKNTLGSEFKVLHNIDDSDGNNILDHLGRPLEGQVIFCIKPC